MKKLKSARVLAVWLALAASLSAQQYSFHAYRQADGLNNLAVRALATDRFGFLWVGTENGVYRFLGSGFERFGAEQGIAEATAIDVISDPSGTIWVGTKKNLYRWDGLRFQPAGREPIPIASPRHIATEDARHLLIASKGQLYRLEHDAAGRMLSYTPVFSGPMVAALPELKQVERVSMVRERSGSGTIWLACNKKLLSLSENRLGSRMAPGDGTVTVWDMSKGLAEESWDGVLKDHTGTVWAAGQTHVMVLLQGAKRFIDRSFPCANQESVYGLAPMVEDRAGRVIVIDSDGIVRWEGHRWRHINQNSGLLFSNHITAVTFDATGDLWLGSNGRGLLNWSGYQNWESWSNAQRLPSPIVWSISAHSGRVIVGTAKGPAWIDMRTGAVAPLFAERFWKYGEVSAVGASSDGSYWVGALTGTVLRIDPKTGRTDKLAKLPAYILTALGLPDGHVFFATRQGLWVSKDGHAPHHTAAADALLGSSTTVEAACAAPDGAAWFVGDNRLLRFKNGAWSAPPIDGLPRLNGALLALSCAADGSVWTTGLRTGTWRMALDHERLKASQLSLPAEFKLLAPLAISVDRRGWVWLGTDMGLMVWNGKAWRHLTEESGLIWNDVNQNAILSADDGSLWVGTSGGVSHLIHPERVFNQVSLAVSLTDIRRGTVNYLGVPQLTLPWAGSPLSFRISSPTTRNRSELALKYYLAGATSDWMNTPNGLVSFNRLEPGMYTFMAMACNPGLDACSPPVKVYFRILPPWWRTNGFYALCLIALLLLLAVCSRLYARHLLAEALQLEKQVSERTRQLKTRTKELEVSREQLRIQATHDVLTGMLNRAAILRALEEEMGRAQWENQTVVVALIDLDHFKRINDTYGHLAGDDALRWFADAIQTAIRSYDHVGRYGGEEFLLILTKVPREIIEQRLTNLHDAISNLKIRVQGVQLRIDCSVGATVYDPSDSVTSVESLLAIIDKALYAAKAAGRNRVVFRPPGYLSNLTDTDTPFRDSSSDSSLE